LHSVYFHFTFVCFRFAGVVALFQEELKALRNEESLIKQRTARRLIEVEARKKEIKRLIRLRIEEIDESISVKSKVLDASHPSGGQNNAS
jgi:tRNA U54 and U55 pseudouridine synthase Pus10